MVEMRSGALEVVLSYVEAAQQARRSQREDDWQRVSELPLRMWSGSLPGMGPASSGAHAGVGLRCWPPCR